MAHNLIIIRLLAAAAVVAALATPAAVQGQGTGGAASCTASLITSFTPCLNFLTSSTNGGGSPPTQDCCRSLASLMSASTGCACLILTGGVPLVGPINRTLAVSLPKACNSGAVPLQCQDTSAQIPAAGPVADTPSSAGAATPATPETEAPAAPVDPTGTAPAVSQGETRPAVLPSSARRASAADGHATAAAVALLLAVGAALM
ncbi:hypothetical protein HU200_016127 [Digitaria exilis]|uniref:Bifunctional inhibitor/plant lipid transfer protein/seed storage helical domain-containing protein n=1 Tax=Digitaria exilis TaxID=1010633 RepID=A0A835F9F6_9POAL|nr:hypothetical protein HU200_016127 [Digitaria exilis]CAB3455811.1 unnamed protein product [Digitaria exilis]